jgi:putative FmdB family regulatory protein
MPIYEYEHLAFPCSLGKIFEIRQSIQEDSLTHCPECKGPVRKYISRIGISIEKTNAEIRDMGLTKLVKRDDGVYENMTRRDGESRYMEAGKPETMPDFSKIISD